MQTKMETKWESCSPSLAIAGFVKEGFRVRVPLLAHNINDLAPKTVWTSVDITSKCGQNKDGIGDFTWKVPDCEELVGGYFN